jgi:hypothetical protein
MDETVVKRAWVKGDVLDETGVERAWFKGTVARDFLVSVFFMDLLYMGPIFRG